MPPDHIIDRRMTALGTEVRVACSGPDADRRCRRALAVIRRVEQRLSRFRDDSELTQLNRDPRTVVPASPLLRDGIRAALWAAEHSGGLVDPALLSAIERAGYTASMTGTHRTTAAEALPLPPGRPAHRPPTPGRAAIPHSPITPGPPNRPAAPASTAVWRQISVDDEHGTISRPPGLRLDLGGSGKGFAADLAAATLQGAPRWLIDCGGDLRTGGRTGTQDVHVAAPGGATTAPALAVLDITRGAVATSAIHARRWTTAAGRPAHHLLDPATGEPAWTGLVQVTALADDVLSAETLAKTALLRGAAAARDLLAPRGGVLVHDDGVVEPLGRLPLAPAHPGLQELTR